MSTAQEIEAAIRGLSTLEREKLIKDLPSILPELEDDVEWHRIIRDPRPRQRLTALGDAIEHQIGANPECFPEIKDTDFGPPS